MNVGPYDIWAIQFGYTPFEKDSERISLLERSTEPALIFGQELMSMVKKYKNLQIKENYHLIFFAMKFQKFF
jgi:hypothetical protein